MRPWMFAMLAKQRLKTTLTFIANGVWKAPVTTNKVITVTGKGAAGTPGQDAYSDPSVTMYRIERYRQQYTRQADGSYIQDGSPALFTVSEYSYTDTSTGKPPDYCEPASGPVYYCHSYVWGSQTTPGTYYPAVPPTTGASATAFGKTFPGGTGVAATPVTFTNVPVMPNTQYTLAVPSGGSVQFTYES